MEPDRTFAPHVIPAGPGLELRPAIVADAAALYALIDRNRTHLSEWLAWATPDYLETGLRDFVAARETENLSRKALTTTIWTHGVLCGSIAMHQIDWLRRNTSIGYWLDMGYQGRGVATEACRALVTEAFSVYGLHRVEIRCASGNHRSAAIPQRLGFREEGILREAEPLHGKFVDLRLFSMLAHEWLEPPIGPKT